MSQKAFYLYPSPFQGTDMQRCTTSALREVPSWLPYLPMARTIPCGHKCIMPRVKKPVPLVCPESTGGKYYRLTSKEFYCTWKGMGKTFLCPLFRCLCHTARRLNCESGKPCLKLASRDVEIPGPHDVAVGFTIGPHTVGEGRMLGPMVCGGGRLGLLSSGGALP